jgi:hypothetical protein
MKIWDVKSGRQCERAPIKVAEVVQGYQLGVSNAWGKIEVSLDVREKAVGNAFHANTRNTEQVGTSVLDKICNVKAIKNRFQ